MVDIGSVLIGLFERFRKLIYSGFCSCDKKVLEIVNMFESEVITNEINALSESIRRKSRALKAGIDERNSFLDATFKPIVNPLVNIVEELKKESIDNKDKELENNYERELNESMTDWSETIGGDINDGIDPHDSEVQTIDDDVLQHTQPSRLSILAKDIAYKGVLTRKYLLKMLDNNTNRKYHVYGARMTDDGLMVGDSELIIDEHDNLSINGKIYKGTIGLFELLFKSNPQQYTLRDLNKFKHICNETNSHKKHYSRTSPVYRNSSTKYKKIISSIFPSQKGTVTGKGMKLKQLHQTNVFYYRDINELVDRMRLINESIEAGHTGLDNEMIALTEELKRKDVIGF